MGVNSTEVAYGFGQFGSACTNTTDNTITAPDGLVIVAISFMEDGCGLTALVAEDPDVFFNTAAAAHDGGRLSLQVNGGVSSSTTVAFDVTTASQDLKIGDEVYLTTTGALLGTIAAFNPGDDANAITLSDAASITDDHYVSFKRPGDTHNQGTGGETLSSVHFPAGATIFGRWKSVKPDAAKTIIAYFGA